MRPVASRLPLPDGQIARRFTGNGWVGFALCFPFVLEVLGELMRRAMNERVLPVGIAGLGSDVLTELREVLRWC